MRSSSNCASKKDIQTRQFNGVSNICSINQHKYETTFSPRTMLNTRKIRLNLLKKREQKHEYMYNKKEVADQLTVSIATVDRLIRTKKITVIKIGSCLRITEDALQQFIADYEVR